ncbi:MAG: LamG domain-containing protein [Planctomycetota bacterium]
MRVWSVCVMSACVLWAWGVAAQETKGPILYLTFDDAQGMTAKDASGNGRDATVKTDAKGAVAEVADVWVKDGKKGGAMRFDGENVYLAVPPTGLDREDKPFTFEAWVNGEGVLAHNGDTDASLARHWTVEFALGTRKFNYCVGKSQVKGQVWDALEHQTKISGWTHVAVTYDGEGELSFHLNGKRVGSVVWEEFVPCEAQDQFAIGAWYHSQKWVGLFKGMMDEVKLYDYMRSPEEIAADAAQ